MKRRCKALAEDDVIPHGGIKELAVTIGIISIFRASAGVVPWSGTKLDDITKLLIQDYKIVDSSVQEGVGTLEQHG
jgi:hypothetical protein